MKGHVRVLSVSLVDRKYLRAGLGSMVVSSLLLAVEMARNQQAIRSEAEQRREEERSVAAVVAVGRCLSAEGEVQSRSGWALGEVRTAAALDCQCVSSLTSALPLPLCVP